MHIRHLVVTDNFAGAERYVATTAAELARRGHTVDVIGGDQAAMRHALGDSPVELHAAPGMRAALRALAAKPRPDLVHTHMTNADVAAVATRPLVRRPVVSTLHFAQPRGHDGLTRRTYGIIPRLVTHEIAISTFVAEHAGGHPTVIPNGVPDPRAGHTSSPGSVESADPSAPDTSRSDAAPADAHHPDPAGTPDTRRSVVLVAQRFETEKRTADALGAFAESGLADHGWELHLAGRGAQLTDLEQLAATLGIADTVRFVGHVDDLAARMDTAAIFLATADAEPFGLSVVEAMAHGLPVVAADGGAHRETLGPATPETLYPPTDTAACARALTRLGADPDLRAELAARARARYEAEFTIATHVDRLEALYRTLVTR